MLRTAFDKVKGKGRNRPGWLEPCRLRSYEAKLSDYPVFTIRARGPPKPDPVKRRPPTARRFYLTELTVSLGYIFCYFKLSSTLLV
jgi:hypothetical protein